MRHGWLIQYGVLVLVAVLLGAILGAFPLFKEATFLGTRLKASHLVQFLGYGAGLAFLILMAHRASFDLREDTLLHKVLRHLLLPIATLVVVSIGYKVLLLVLGPFLSKGGRGFYDWSFVVGIVASALWIGVTWYKHAESFVQLADRSDSASLKRHTT